jgi:hypothetical protein
MSSDYQALALVQKELRNMRQMREDYISSGRANDYPEYKHVCGIILGLTAVDNVINDLVQRINNED